MRVVIDVTPLSVPPSGIGVYLRELTAGLGRAGGDEIVALSLGGRNETVGLATHLGPLPGVRRVHRRIRGARIVRRALNTVPLPTLELLAGRSDAFIGSEWLYPRQRSGLRVAIVYDLVPLRFPEWTTAATRALHLRKLADVRRADLVICISEATARDVAEQLGVGRDRIHVARPGVADRFRTATAGRSPVGSRPYVAALCTREPRKNLIALIEAYRLLRGREPDLALVLVGAAGWGDDAVGRAIADHRLVEDVVVTGYLPDAEVPGVLAGARAFCWPALFEGFGIPIVEALAAGVPVVCADDPSMDEAAGGAAIRVPASDPIAIAAALERVIGDEQVRADLIARGRAHAATLTWDATAAAVLAGLHGRAG